MLCARHAEVALEVQLCNPDLRAGRAAIWRSGAAFGISGFRIPPSEKNLSEKPWLATQDAGDC